MHRLSSKDHCTHIFFFLLLLPFFFSLLRISISLGMSAGVCCKAINYPLLVFKNNTQQGLPLSFNPRIVYRGLPMACLNLGGTTGIQFWFTGFFQKFLTGGNSSELTPSVDSSPSVILYPPSSRACPPVPLFHCLTQRHYFSHILTVYTCPILRARLCLMFFRKRSGSPYL